MATKFDVFVSYRHAPDIGDWMAIFHTTLETWIQRETTIQANVFRDKPSIAAGDEWSEAIKTALSTSRILIAVLTPTYFTSKWCVAEWRTIEQKEATHESARNQLIIPVKFSNGHHYPDFVRKRQFDDELTDFRVVNNPIIPPKSERHALLVEKVKALAVLVAERLQSVQVQDSDCLVDPDTVLLPNLPSSPTNPTP